MNTMWTIEGREVRVGDKLYDRKYAYGLVEIIEEVGFFGTPHLRARTSKGTLGLFDPNELSWNPPPITVGSLGGAECASPDNTEYFKTMTKEIGLDPVNHPAHYTNHPSGIECIQITEHMTFCLGNAVKYIWRADLKHDAIQDLEKAKWYIEREIAKRRANDEAV